MNIDELKAEIKRLDQVIDDARAKRRAHEAELAHLTAKFKVGDRVRCGALHGALMEVNSITWKHGRPVYVAARVLINGSLGSANYELYGEIVREV